MMVAWKEFFSVIFLNLAHAQRSSQLNYAGWHTDHTYTHTHWLQQNFPREHPCCTFPRSYHLGFNICFRFMMITFSSHVVSSESLVFHTSVSIHTNTHTHTLSQVAIATLTSCWVDALPASHKLHVHQGAFKLCVCLWFLLVCFLLVVLSLFPCSSVHHFAKWVYSCGKRRPLC